MLTLKVGNLLKEVEFLVDSGATRSSLVESVWTGEPPFSGAFCKITGVENRVTSVPILKPLFVSQPGNQGNILHEFLWIPGSGVNLLGRDLMGKLGLTITIKDQTCTVRLAPLRAEDEAKVDPNVWARPGNPGLLRIVPVKIHLKTEVPVYRSQYPIRPEAEAGLKPVVKELLDDGLIEPSDSPYCTPILPVKKPNGTWRMVQDLREVNNIVVPRAPIVPDPHTILRSIPNSHVWYTVVDLKSAFFCVPLAPESRAIFAFQWPHPDTGQLTRFQWRVLPQGYTESPTIFGETLAQVLQKWTSPPGTILTQYVDDLLISGEQGKIVRQASIDLLSFLGNEGLRVTKEKLQFCEQEVKYLGLRLRGGKKYIDPKRIKGIQELTMPKTKRELRGLLGTLNFCRQWIEGFSELVQPFLKKLTNDQPDVLVLEKQDYKLLEKLKKILVSAPALGLSDPKKPSHLFVTIRSGVAKGVLAQKKAGSYQPTGYFSKHLDPVVLGWPGCLQACAAAATMVKVVRKLYPFEVIVLHSPHQIRAILSHTARRWMTDARLLQIEATLLEQPELLVTTTDHLGPADGLSETVTREFQEEHDCVSITDLQTKYREDLQETPIEGAWNLYTDGSSRVIDGKRYTGYAIVEDGSLEVESGALTPSMSAQTAELYALKRALEISEGKSVNIYTDSKYACGVIQVFGKLWCERGLLTSQGRNLAHHRLVQETLEALDLPAQVAIIHVAGHQKGRDPEAVGNRTADELAKKAALEGKIRMAALIPVGLDPSPPFSYQQREKEMAEGQGATMTDGVLVLPDGRQWLPEGIVREVLKALHEGGHWGTRALVGTFLQKYVGRRVWSHANALVARCIPCQKANKNNPRKTELGGRPLVVHPFESMQCDFIDLPKVGSFKHCLVFTDQLTGWVEAFPTARATAGAVSKLILEQIIPRFGIVQSIDSDRGSHFTQRVLQEVMSVLGIQWKLHTPWHPQSSGKTERMNQSIKTQLLKLMQQTQLPWTKVLPLALYAIRTRPNQRSGLTPFECLYGMGQWDVSPKSVNPNLDLFKDAYLKKHLLALFSIISKNREQSLVIQRVPLEAPVHSFQPGQWAYIKAWKTEPLALRWLGPYQILLTTETAIRTREAGWTHHIRAKHAADPEDRWEATPQPSNELKTVLKRVPNV